MWHVATCAPHLVNCDGQGKGRPDKAQVQVGAADRDAAGLTAVATQVFCRREPDSPPRSMKPDVRPLDERKPVEAGTIE